MSHLSNCCDTAASLTATADALAADAADPTLQACCARDLAQQAASARLAATLAAADRVGAAARAATRAAVTPPLSDDDDDSDQLATLRAARLAQLKAAAAAAADAGPPGVRDVASAAGVTRAAEAAAPGPTVAHVAAPGYGAGDALEELLTTLAAEYRGTVFVRWAPRDGTKLSGLPPPPTLAVFRGGALTAATSIPSLCAGDGGLAEERVAAWLRAARALARRRVDDTGASPSPSASSESEDGGGGRSVPPCEVCGRTYAHTHVQTVRRGGGGRR